MESHDDPRGDFTVFSFDVATERIALGVSDWSIFHLLHQLSLSKGWALTTEVG